MSWQEQLADTCTDEEYSLFLKTLTNEDLMMIYKAYSAILQSGETEEEALDFARGYCFNDDEATQQSIGYATHIDTIQGIGVYYDYAADYYFFTDEITD